MTTRQCLRELERVLVLPPVDNFPSSNMSFYLKFHLFKGSVRSEGVATEN
jgi:hypothetical protein